MSNKKLGNDFEERFCKMLYDQGFWVHKFAQNADGQPADILAARDGNSYLIDCKVCSNGIFDLSRIEENQINSMALWLNRGNGCGWFALEFDNGNIYMIRHTVLEALTPYHKAIDEREVLLNGYLFEFWCKSW